MRTYPTAIALICGLSFTIPASGQLRFTEDFSNGLDRWEIVGTDRFEIIDSGDPAHGPALELLPDGNVYALIRGSETWGNVRIEGDVLFPTDEHNYLGLLYHHTRRGDRADFGNIYIKGNGSYLRVNPHRDGNVGRTLYEEYRTPLEGPAAIRIGEWQHFKLEVDSRAAHLYVGDMETPRLTFSFLELTSGAIGFQPRCCGGPTWIDNIRVSSIASLQYDGPPRPSIDYGANPVVRTWEVAGPYPEHHDDVARNHDSRDWRPYQPDGRGAVISGAVTDWTGDSTVAYFRAHVTVPRDTTVVLGLSSVDDLALWVNGHFLGYVAGQGLAWHDFWTNPDHDGVREPIRVRRGRNDFVFRVRGGVYASGGFYAVIR